MRAGRRAGRQFCWKQDCELDDTLPPARRRRAPNAAHAERRAAVSLIGPLRAELQTWHEANARLDALALAGRAGPDDCAAAAALVNAIRQGRATLAASLAQADAKIATSGHVRDLALALERAEQRAHKAHQALLAAQSRPPR